MSRRPSSFVPPAAPVDVAAEVELFDLIVPPPELALQLREVLGFTASLLTALPLATTLLCVRPHEGEHLVLATHSAAPAAGNGYERVPAFVGPELNALVVAAEQGRGTWATMADWCARKGRDPGWRLTRIEALGGVRAAGWLGWTTGQVLRALGLELVEVLT